MEPIHHFIYLKLYPDLKQYGNLNFRLKYLYLSILQTLEKFINAFWNSIIFYPILQI